MALVLVVFWLVATATDGPIAFFRPADDGYYYYDLVRSTWTGQGLSTDGIHSTNGFHPLWFLVLLPFGAVFKEPNNGLVVVAQFLGFASLGAAVSGIVATARRLGTGWFAAIVGGLALTFAPWRGVVAAGVEGGLTLALLAWLTYWAVVVATAPSKDRVRDWAMTGLLAGLTMLSRLDTLFVVGCVVAVLVLKVAPKPPRALVALLAPPTLLVGAYLAINLVATGHPLPVTASLKSSFPEPGFSRAFITSNAKYYIALVPAWLGVALLGRRLQAYVVGAVALGATTFGVYLALFGQGVFWWHFVSLLPIAAVGVALAVDRGLHLLPSGRPQFAASGAIGVVLALVLVVPLVGSMVAKYPNGDRQAASGWRVEAERAGKWANDNLPDDALLSMKDSGAFAFYTEQPVMNLDGVVSDRDFNQQLCDGTAVQEMIDSGVEYVAHHSVPVGYDEFEIMLPCWDEDTFPSRLVMSPDDEVYRSKPYWQGGPDQLFVIWRFIRN